MAASASALMHHAADEVVASGERPELVASRPRTAFLPPCPHRDMRVAAIAGEIDEGLGHEGGAQAVLFGDLTSP
jgi:hypothetical protein